jgi:succinate dehydrogenase / fumarate reductase membrane anchor subunit
MSLQSDLAKVRGLGSAKEGVAHWWAQRLTAVALVPLILWFVVSLISLVGAEQEIVKQWISAPWVSILLMILVAAMFHHAQLGVQVVLEDYIHTEWLKLGSIMLVKFGAATLFAASVFAILKISFSG